MVGAPITCKQWLFLALCSLIALSCVFLKVTDVSVNISKIRSLPQKFTGNVKVLPFAVKPLVTETTTSPGANRSSTEQPGHIPQNVYQRYLQIQKSYQERLAAIVRHQYGSSKQYIHYGEPIRKILPNASRSVKKILVWTPFFGNNKWFPPKMQCEANITCVSTTNRQELLNSHSVIVHARDIRRVQDLPDKRLPHQRWVYLIQESPYHTGLKIRNFNGIFNWTATYRRDSDINMAYFQIKEKEKNLTNEAYQQLIGKILASKSGHIIAYMNSNCDATHTKRLSYVRELNNYLAVDTYGVCGKMRCPRGSPNCTKTMSQHKFYLSMENSHCRDYITEKVAQPLFDWHAVPVVMGGADPGNYEDLLPPGSYIHTSGFGSPKELAEYLLILDKYPTLYEKYHRWKRSWERATGPLWCQYCRKLHDMSLPSQSYHDFIGWYNEDTCKS